MNCIKEKQCLGINHCPDLLNKFMQYAKNNCELPKTCFEVLKNAKILDEKGNLTKKGRLVRRKIEYSQKGFVDLATYAHLPEYPHGTPHIRQRAKKI